MTNLQYEEEHARSEALFEHIGTGAIATDEHGRIYRINDAALELLEYEREEVIGEWFPKVVVQVDSHGNKIPPLDRPITTAFLSGKAVSVNTYYETKTGNILPVSLTVSPILLDGKLIGAVQVFQDISLEYEVDRMKTEFISIASHQLRTPLSAINTYANMMQSGFYGPLNNEQKQHMSTIIAAINRMNGLISTLLDVSQFEAGKISVSNQEVDIIELVENIINDLTATEVSRNIKIKTAFSNTSLVLQCDRLLLGEIYSNLISNAMKYSKENGTVKVSVKRKTKEIVFSVEDNGYGIPKHLQKYIFTKFYRAENIKKVDTTGTGLGLYLARQIAEVLGGRLWFESKDGKGSTFYFALPKQKVNQGSK